MNNMYDPSMPAEISGRRVHIAAVAVAVPPLALDQSQSLTYLLDSYADKLTPRSLSLLRKLFAHPSISKRHFAFDDPESFLRESPDSRMERFLRWSVDLSEESIRKAMDAAGVTAQDVAGLVVNTCTGYLCPGIATYLIERLGLRRDTRVYDLAGSGCGGAVPNLEIAQSLVAGAGDKVVLSASVEICSATFQMGDSLSLLASNALFGDGAAAAVLWNRPRGLELVSSTSLYVPEDREAIRYIYRNGQLHNQLSTSLPHLVKKAAARVTENLLRPYSLNVRDIGHWAIHTGGEKIINTIRDEIGLTDIQLQATRRVLSEYGNMSSPTVWFVLNDLIAQGIEQDDWCVMLAFGAGLSVHAGLLRKAGA